MTDEILLEVDPNAVTLADVMKRALKEAMNAFEAEEAVRWMTVAAMARDLMDRPA